MEDIKSKLLNIDNIIKEIEERTSDIEYSNQEMMQREGETWE